MSAAATRDKTKSTKAADRSTTAAVPADRNRPLPEEMIPTEAGLAAARALAAHSATTVLTDATAIEDLDHPIERAVGATALIDALAEIVIELKEIRQNAIKDAYEEGRGYSGWYGYSAIAGQIGISPSRVRQILFDITSSNATGAEVKRDTEASAIRQLADARRDARKLLDKGESHSVIAAKTGLPLGEIHQMARSRRS